MSNQIDGYILVNTVKQGNEYLVYAEDLLIKTFKRKEAAQAYVEDSLQEDVFERGLMGTLYQSRQKRIDELNKRQFVVYCYETDTFYESFNMASSQLHIDKRVLYKLLATNMREHNGYHLAFYPKDKNIYELTTGTILRQTAHDAEKYNETFTSIRSALASGEPTELGHEFSYFKKGATPKEFWV